MTAASRNIRKLRTQLSLGEVGARTDNADNTSYFNECLSELAAGGVLNIGIGDWRFQDPLTVSTRGILIRGEGSVSDSSTATGATKLIGDHLEGAVLKITQDDCSVESLLIGASAARKAGSRATGYVHNAGLWVEGPDVSGGTGTVQRLTVRDVVSIDQPGIAFLQVGESASAYYERARANYCGGHGFVFDNGVLTNRTNPGAPGIVTLRTCRANDCEGHQLVIGHPTDATNFAYRFYVEQFEAYRNATDAAYLYVPYGTFAYGQNMVFDTCAFGADSTEYVGGLAIGGRDSIARNSRFINVAPPVRVLKYAGGPTRGIRIDGMRIASDLGTIHAVAVNVDSGCTQVSARTRSDARGADTTYTKLIDTDFEGFELDESDGVRADADMEMRSFSSTPKITLADDTVQALEFSNNTGGIAAISCQTESNSTCLVSFRVGSSPFVTALSAGADVSVGTGALTDGAGDGIDTDLNVYAHTDKKLYIKNRRGGSRDIRVSLLSVTTGQLITML